MDDRLPVGLSEVMALFDEHEALTNKRIAELLGISYRAAYQRTYRLRVMGHIRSVPGWYTIRNEGQAPYRDDSGNFRSWLELYKGDGTPDAFQTVFDPRGGNNGDRENSR